MATDIYARVTDDGYMTYAATAEDYTGCDNFWPDCFDDEFVQEHGVETICLEDVPDDLTADLCEQGGSGQVFADGYEAWQAALPAGCYTE